MTCVIPLCQGEQCYPISNVDTSIPAPFLDQYQTFLEFEFEIERMNNRVFEDYMNFGEEFEDSWIF